MREHQHNPETVTAASISHKITLLNCTSQPSTISTHVLYTYTPAVALLPQAAGGCAGVDRPEVVTAVGGVEVQKPCAVRPAVVVLAAGTGWGTTVGQHQHQHQHQHHLLTAA